MCIRDRIKIIIGQVLDGAGSCINIGNSSCEKIRIGGPIDVDGIPYPYGGGTSNKIVQFGDRMGQLYY